MRDSRALLDRGLAQLDRLGQAPLHLERIARMTASAERAGGPRRRPRDRHATFGRARSRRRSARGSSRPSRGSRASRGAAPARVVHAARRARVPRRGARARLRCRPRRPPPARARRRPTAISATVAERGGVSSASSPMVEACSKSSRRGRRRRARSAARPPRARRRSGSSSHARMRRRWASSWRPCQCSTAAHRAVSSTRRIVASGGRSSIASSSVGAAAVELADRPQRRGKRHAHRRPGDPVSGPGAAAARPRTSGRRGGGRAGGGAAAGLEQDLDRLLVARAARLLDVVGPLRGVGAVGRERVGCARVGGKAPAAARRRVHGAAHERVAEDEAARHVGRAHEVEASRSSSASSPWPSPSSAIAAARSRLERLARHRRAVEQRARLGRQRLELTGDRARDRRGHPGPPAPSPSIAATSAPARPSCSR